jgi:hypothetical protein
MHVKIKLDLVRLLQLAAPQVSGSDERSLLYQFLSRNKDAQLVDIDLGQVLVTVDSDEDTLGKETP